MLPCDEKIWARYDYKVGNCTKNKCIDKADAWLDTALMKCCKTQANNQKKNDMKQCNNSDDSATCKAEAQSSYQAALEMCEESTIFAAGTTQLL
jgi:hypothetical protein